MKQVTKWLAPVALGAALSMGVLAHAAEPARGAGLPSFDQMAYPATAAPSDYLEKMRQAAQSRAAPGVPDLEKLEALQEAAGDAGTMDSERLRGRIQRDFSKMAPN